jgi:flagellar motor switch protein FliM
VSERILSRDEIHALTTPAGEAGSAPDPGSSSPVVRYDFRRPDRVSKEELRSLHLLHDRFSRNITSSLAAYLRTSVEFSVAAIEQLSYSEFLMSLPDPTAFYSVRIRPLEGLSALELNPSLAFTIVDRMLGGRGDGAVPDRALTEIEQTVVDAVVKLMLEHITETWKAVMDVQCAIDGRETRPQMLPIAGRNEVMILIAFDVKISDVRGMVHLCIPAAAVEAAGLSFSQGWQQSVPQPTSLQRASITENLGHVPLSVTAMLRTRFRVRDALELSQGDVLSLGIPLRSPVRVRVGDLVKFIGRLTVTSGRASVVISDTPADVSTPGGQSWE